MVWGRTSRSKASLSWLRTRLVRWKCSCRLKWFLMVASLNSSCIGTQQSSVCALTCWLTSSTPTNKQRTRSSQNKRDLRNNCFTIFTSYESARSSTSLNGSCSRTGKTYVRITSRLYQMGTNTRSGVSLHSTRSQVASRSCSNLSPRASSSSLQSSFSSALSR
jgi:hypothetical protein